MSITKDPKAWKVLESAITDISVQRDGVWTVTIEVKPSVDLDIRVRRLGRRVRVYRDNVPDG